MLWALSCRRQVERVAFGNPVADLFEIAVFAEFDEGEESFDAPGGRGMRLGRVGECRG